MTAILGTYGLTFQHSREHSLFEDFSHELFAGDFQALLGPNGCGKSTLLKIMAGITNTPAIQGQVRFRGTDFYKERQAFRARHVAYVGQDFRTEFKLSVQEAVLLARTTSGTSFFGTLSKEDRQAVESAMEDALCARFKNRDLQSLSSGERQLVGLARVLAQNPKVYLLDEAFSQMDLHHQAHSLGILKERARNGAAVLFVSHDVNLAGEWADKILLVGPRGIGRVAFGETHAVLTETNLKRLYPEAELSVGPNPVSGAPYVFFKNVAQK